MFEIDNWIEEITQKIKAAFNENVLFIGYQGSYRRGEANEHSDIDMVVILEHLDTKELEIYKNIVQSMNYSEKACGYISSKSVLEHWSKFELFQLYNDTKPIYGSLENLIPALTKEDSLQAARIGAQNIYHTAIHSFLYSQDKKCSLSELYKGIFFVLQSKHFYEKNEYVLSKNELYEKLSCDDKKILEISRNRESIQTFSEKQIEDAFSLLIEFCSNIIRKGL